MNPITPRELIAVTVGMLAALAMVKHPPCRRECCLPQKFDDLMLNENEARLHRLNNGTRTERGLGGMGPC